MFNLFNSVVNTVKSVFGGGSKPAAPKPAPKPAPTTYKPLAPLPMLPAPNFYIAKWGDTPAQIAAGQARNNQLTANTQRVTGQISSTLTANQKAMEANRIEMARQAAIREQQRKEKQAALDQTFNSLKLDRTKRAQQALDATMKKNGGTMLSWKSYLNDDGSIKAKGQKVDGYEIPENWYNETGTIKWAKSEWQKWYDSDAGTYQKAKDEYKKKAQSLIDQTEKGQKGGLLDWFTGGSKDNARATAQRNLDDLNKNQTKRYDDKLNKFLKDQATKKAQIEATKKVLDGARKTADTAEHRDSLNVAVAQTMAQIVNLVRGASPTDAVKADEVSMRMATLGSAGLGSFALLVLAPVGFFLAGRRRKPEDDISHEPTASQTTTLTPLDTFRAAYARETERRGVMPLQVAA